MSKKNHKKRSTLRDVARNANVSVATVSRVLNGAELVSERTRERVTSAIKALDFVPSAAARSLNSGRSRIIGALVPTLDHSIFARYLDALENRLSRYGYTLVVAVTASMPEIEEQKTQSFLDMGVDGLIVSGKARSPGFDALVDRFGIPTIITSFFDISARYPTIGYDNAAIAVSAFDYLYALGHRALGVVHGPTEMNDRTQVRIDAIRNVAHEAELSFWPVSMDVAGGAQAVQGMIARGPMPSAILCLSDVLALGALFELQRSGISVPEEISIMGFDNLEWSSISEPGITSIQLPAAEMGEKAADAITDWLKSGVRAEPMALGAHIIARGSTRIMRLG